RKPRRMSTSARRISPKKPTSPVRYPRYAIALTGPGAERRLLPLVPGDGQFADDLTVDRVFRERLVHLVPALFGPEHFQIGRRVPAVLRRVVVRADAEDLAAGRNVERFGELVLDLPVEVEPRHVEDGLLAAVGIDDHPAEALAAQVHV